MTTAAIAIPDADPSKPEPLVAYNRMTDERRVLMRQICRANGTDRVRPLTDAEMAMLCEFGMRSGLDPFRKQIYGIIMQGEFHLVTSIGGLRAVARRNGLAGVDAPKFAWADERKTVPHACEITVYRWGPPAVDGTRQREPYTARCLFNEFNRETKIWREKPSHMLAKCTEACAIRMGFEETTGLCIRDEFPETTGRVTRVMPDARDPRALLAAPAFDAEVEPDAEHDPTDKDAP